LKKYNILAMSYCFPPMAFPRSIQVSRLLKNLDASCTVICGFDTEQRYDPSISPNIEQIVEKTIRLPYEPSKSARFMNSVTSFFYLSIFSNFPDAQRGWAMNAYQYYADWQRINCWNPDVLVTFGQPMSDHLFGLLFKKVSDLPWIAHFSDPWVDNMFRRDNYIAYYRNRNLERKVIAAADAVIFTSQETLDLVMSKYPELWRDKAYYLPHSLDRSIYLPDYKPPEEHYIMRSVGNFYGSRSPEPLFSGLDRIAAESPELLKKVKVELVGSLGRGMHKLINKYKRIEPIVEFYGSVNYLESIRMMQTAHCLLVIDAPSESSVFFPSKLVDYIGADRFILAISPEGTCEQLVKRLGGAVAHPLDSDAIYYVLKQVLKERPSNMAQSIHEYDCDVVGQNMVKIIETVVNKKI